MVVNTKPYFVRSRLSWFLEKAELCFLHYQSRILNKIQQHPLKGGDIVLSPGGTQKYKVIGACCRLYDRENLPYPSCSLDWKGKQPSWRRIGKRFIVDLASKRSPSYSVQVINYPDSAPFVITLHWVNLSSQRQNWWNKSK